MPSLKIYGVNYDHIRIEGDITKDIYIHDADPRYFVFSDGTVIRAEYDCVQLGCTWDFTVVQIGQCDAYKKLAPLDAAWDCYEYIELDNFYGHKITWMVEGINFDRNNG